MKINVLSLESTEDDLSSVDPANVDNEVESTAETEDLESTAEVESTGEDTSEEDAADEEQAEALEAQFIVLEDLIQSWQAAGKLTPKMLHQASESLPELKITNGGRTHEQRYSLAMEGVGTKIKEALKGFWETLSKLWKRFVQYLMRFLDGSYADLSKITQSQASQMVAVVSKASAILGESRQFSGRQVPNLWESHAMKREFAEAGGEGMPAAMAKIRAVLDQAPQVIHQAEQFIDQLEAWHRSFLAGGNVPAPESFEARIGKFADAALEVNEAYSLTLKVDPDVHVTPQAIEAIITAIPLHTEYGLARRFFKVGMAGQKLIDEANKQLMNRELTRDFSNDDRNWRELYKQMKEALITFKAILHVFRHATQMQRGACRLGSWYLHAIKIEFESCLREMAHPDINSNARWLVEKSKEIDQLLEMYEAAYK
jgi:hypothetical protein